MAVTLEIGVSDLLPKFLTNALILLSALEAARAISTGTLQAVFYGFYHFCVFIQSDSHRNISFFLLLYTECQEHPFLSSFLFLQSMIQ